MSLVSNKSILDITDILNEYSEDIQESIIKAAEDVAKDGANKLKQTSPKNTGKYARGWKVQTKKGNGYIKSVVYNTNPGLTQMLEKPHIIRNQWGQWGTSKPIVHIKPVEQECISKYEKQVIKIIKNGGK